MAETVAHTSGMARSVLAANLGALMRAHEPPLSGRSLGAAADVDPKTVTRILKGEHAANIDTIAALAAVFHLLPWQMLVPDMDPENPPVTQLSRTEAGLYQTLRRAASELGKSSD